MKKLGIIGGLGPAATVRLMGRIIDFTYANCDQEHLDITVLCRPQIPDRTAYLLGKPGAESFIPPMRQAAWELIDQGCTVLATPCNTAHSRLDEITQDLPSQVQFVSMPQETMTYAASLGCCKVGVLATDGARSAGVYDAAAKLAGIQAVWPSQDQQRQVMSVIYDEVKAGKTPHPQRMYELCSALHQAGCDAVVLGCTELSVLGMQQWFENIPVIDALDVLAWKCVQACDAPTRMEPVAPRAEVEASDLAPSLGAVAEALDPEAPNFMAEASDLMPDPKASKTSCNSAVS